VGNALDTTLPELLVELGVETDIRGAHSLGGELLDGLDSPGSTVLEGGTKDLLLIHAFVY
jgi:hypothetical protein